MLLRVLKGFSLGATGVLGLVLTQACSDRRSTVASLQDNAAAVCDPDQPLVVQLRPDGRYALNYGVMDSAQLVRALRNVLPPRPSRLVMVRLEVARTTELKWIVPAIERNGGTAYRLDSACFPGAPWSRFLR